MESLWVKAAYLQSLFLTFLVIQPKQLLKELHQSIQSKFILEHKKKKGNVVAHNNKVY